MRRRRRRTANTTALDFSYVIPHPDPDYVFLDQGAGHIPNSAFTISPTAAHLAVTTPFPTTRCVVNVITSVFVCGPGSPKTFNLDWEVNGFLIVHEKTKREEVFGPVLTNFKGEFSQRSAVVNGTFHGVTGSNLIGEILDAKSNTLIREITVQANP